MTDVLVNGVGWLDVAEEAGQLLWKACKWAPEDDATLRALLPHYSVERISWTLGRSIGAVRQRMVKLEIARPHVYQRASPDHRGAVAA